MLTKYILIKNKNTKTAEVFFTLVVWLIFYKTYYRYYILNFYATAVVYYIKELSNPKQEAS